MDIELKEPEVPDSEIGTIMDPHTTKQQSKICPGVTPLDLPLQGNRGNKRRGKEMERKADDVTDRGKGSEMGYLEFTTPYFIPDCYNCYNCYNC